MWVRGLHRAIKAIEPWGILLAVVGITITWYQATVNRGVRQATLFALASERLVAARDLATEACLEEPKPLQEECLAEPPEESNVGQLRVLEEMAALGVSMARIDARLTYLHNVNLPDAYLSAAVFRSTNLNIANLSGSYLRFASFANADLSYAVLADADLVYSDFSGADLRCADLSGARFVGMRRPRLTRVAFRVHHNRFPINLTDASLIDADLSNTSLKGIYGLKQSQLDEACGDNVALDPGFSIKPCSQSTRDDCEYVRLQFRPRR